MVHVLMWMAAQAVGAAAHRAAFSICLLRGSISTMPQSGVQRCCCPRSNEICRVFSVLPSAGAPPPTGTRSGALVTFFVLLVDFGPPLPGRGGSGGGGGGEAPLAGAGAAAAGDGLAIGAALVGADSP